MKGEVWRDVINYEDYYQVSNLGNLRSKDRQINTTGCVKKSTKRAKLLKLNTTNGGYKFFLFVKNKERKMMLIHRVVYNRFCGEIPKNLEVDHINSIRDDNRLCNLQLLSRGDNTIKALKRNDIPVGVYKNNSNWIARIYIKGRLINLGTYPTKELASQIYQQYKQDYGKINNV